MKNNRIITFHTGLTSEFYVYLSYNETEHYIINRNSDIHTYSLVHLSFDLFDQGFSKIQLVHNGITYDLKLGQNTWTEKELRKSHNLLKLVTGYILNK